MIGEDLEMQSRDTAKRDCVAIPVSSLLPSVEADSKGTCSVLCQCMWGQRIGPMRLGVRTYRLVATWAALQGNEM